MISVGKNLLENLDIQQAVQDEADWDPDILPVPIMNRFAAHETETVSEYVAELSQAGIAVSPASVVSASKWRFGRRPVALIPFVERVLYRAMVEYLRADLPDLERSSSAYRSFVEAPLGHGSNYVIVTDIANFYSSIPTHRLAQELVERTGRWEPVDWLHKLWLALAGGYNGIPQVSEPSHYVAEAYADELHRRLARRGVVAWRYSDDFRIAADTPSECVRILDIFDEEATSLGLFVNERKTYTPIRARYEEMVNASRNRLQDISGEVRGDLAGLTFYNGELVEAEEAEVLRESMTRVLEYWDAETSSQKHDIGTEIELSKLVRLAVDILAFVGDPSVLPHCRNLLLKEPQLTPSVANYLRSMADTDHDVPMVLTKVVDDVAMTSWQTLWLAYVYEVQPRAGTWGTRANSWLRECLQSSSEYVRSQAAWSLALSGGLDRRTWSGVQAQSTRYGSPYIAAALAGLTDGNPRETQVLLSSDRLDRKIFEWAESRCPHPSF